VIERANTTISV